MTGQRADVQLASLLLDVVELLDAVDVDERLRLRQAQSHERDQAVPACQHLGVLAELLEQLRRLIHGGGTGVFESGWNHLRAPLIIAQSLSGLAGMSTCLMPSGLSASQIALMTAALAAIVPASPMPLTPRSLVGDGVTVWSRLIVGISPMPGML